TYSFCNYLRDKQDQALDWKTVVKQAADKAQDFFTQQFPGGIPVNENVCRKQTLHSFSLGDVDFAGLFGVFVKEERNEVKIVKVVNDSLATRGKLGEDTETLDPGDVILEVNGQRITTVTGFQKALAIAPKELSILIRNVKDNKNYRLLFSREK